MSSKDFANVRDVRGKNFLPENPARPVNLANHCQSCQNRGSKIFEKKKPVMNKNT